MKRLQILYNNFEFYEKQSKISLQNIFIKFLVNFVFVASEV
ncbi:hypothetical protein cje147_08095 [Campylobacter jejuni subsp. jejuni 2008-872]|nr:hypothetical protein cje147_08095 [Campylobacter jejuni subsp. jejuni 2008-872]EIB73103.1 hypothetical protein cje4_08455 [Campylobacter jejuni subsp. jejuni 140-16]EIB76840.1 hypothetical protein cje52_03404 [Campylobacter jejuni subsp. jejuni 1213]EIB78664.1 hypothetical protein cje75_05735 [Campylobacter jejuni subsp. jejuni 1798]CEF57658.1 hypothetical protein CJJ5050_01490 [Campylobacter jejuni]